MSEFVLETERYELRAGPAYRFLPDRRELLGLLGGGLLVLLATPETAEAQRRRGGQEAPKELGAWLHVDAAGKIKVFTGKTEVGQNVRTALAQVVAEELHVAVEAVGLVMADTALTPYDMGTFGSRSMPFMAPVLRQAAAAARQVLIGLAARRTGTAPEAWRAEGGRILRPGGESFGYGELTGGERLTAAIDPAPAPIPAAEWRVAGHDHGKVNARAIVTGQEKYTSDLTRPGMLYGRVVRPPAFGAKLASADLAAAQRLPGVTAVRDGDFLGVACADSAQLDAAAAAIRAEWTRAAGQPGTAELSAWLKSHPGGAIDWKPIAGEGVKAVSGSYEVAYIAHVPLEPRAALADWSDGRLTVWTGTQVPFGVQQELAAAFAIPADRVRVIVPSTGSGYGGKHSGECALEAARLAKAAGKPVRLQWTRQEEFTWAYFRPAGVMDIRSGAAADGTLTSWQFHNWNSGRAAIESPYAIPGQVAEFHASDSPLRQGSYRGLAATANVFARECHMDEQARAVGLDPLAFRRKNAADPRLRAVIDAAAERFGWANRTKTPGRGFGLAAGFDKGGYVGTCVEITVAAGRLRVERIVQAFECGAIVNPDQLRNQVSGAIIMGLGGALYEAIDFAQGEIRNPRLSAYRVPRFNDIPPIEIVLLDRRDLPSAGAGEAPIIGIAPAIGNAVFDATGQRLRALPLRLA